MSKFYTYQELQERFPTKEAVSEARDIVDKFLTEHKKEQDTHYPDFKNENTNAVIFGSSVWGLHRGIDDQHTRRSDVDIAIGSGHAGKELENFCADVIAQTGVPVEFTKVGFDEMYQGCFISPSTCDHFRLLAKKFPHKPYKEFKKTMEVDAIPRIEDMTRYIRILNGSTGSDFHGLFANQMERFMNHTWTDPDNLKLLAKLENFPDHFLRKALGMEKMLPCPDSKQRVWQAFTDFPYQWAAKERLSGPFKSMRECSAAYEALIDEVRAGLSESAYADRFRDIAYRMTLSAARSFSMIGHTGSDIGEILQITRIPKGTPVLILTHFGDGNGWVDAWRLEEDFGNPTTGVTYFIKNDPATPYELKQYGQTEIPCFGGDKNLARVDDPIDPVRGWFTYKRTGGGFCSIRACDEATFQRLKGDLDKDDREVMKAHYRALASDALTPEYSKVPRKLLQRVSASV